MFSEAYVCPRRRGVPLVLSLFLSQVLFVGGGGGVPVTGPVPSPVLSPVKSGGWGSRGFPLPWTGGTPPVGDHAGGLSFLLLIVQQISIKTSGQLCLAYLLWQNLNELFYFCWTLFFIAFAVNQKEKLEYTTKQKFITLTYFDMCFLCCSTVQVTWRTSWTKSSFGSELMVERSMRYPCIQATRVLLNGHSAPCDRHLVEHRLSNGPHLKGEKTAGC